MARAWPALVSMAAVVQTLAIASNLAAVDCSLGTQCNLTVTSNVTISNPTNAVAGMELTFVINAGAGGYWVDWGSAFADKPAVWTGANQVTTHRFIYDGTLWRVLSRALSRAVGTSSDDTSTSDTSTGVECTGTSFVPAPNGVYRYEYTISCVNSGGTAVGCQFRMESGNAANGTAYGATPSANTVLAVNLQGLSEEAWTLGLAGRGATVYTPSVMSGIIVAHASAPTAVSLWMRSETTGTATLKAAGTVFSITRVS